MAARALRPPAGPADELACPARPRPAEDVLRRLTERYGSLGLAEPSARASWEMVLDDEMGDDAGRTNLFKTKPWRMLRYVVWRSPPRRLLLVSDNLPDSQFIIDCTHPNVETIHVNYKSWTLEHLLREVHEKAAGQQFTTIGLFDHGGPGQFCLLKSVAGGSIDIDDFKKGGDDKEDVEHFFKSLASYVVKPDDVPPRESRVYRIDILACSVAAGHGMALVQYLEDLTDTNFAASVDPTGNDVETGECDFELETEEGLQVAADYFDVSEIIKWKHLAGLSGGIEKTIDKNNLRDLGRSKQSLSILHNLYHSVEHGSAEDLQKLSRMGSRRFSQQSQQAKPKEPWQWVTLDGVSATGRKGSAVVASAAGAAVSTAQQAGQVLAGGVGGAMSVGVRAGVTGAKTLIGAGNMGAKTVSNAIGGVSSRVLNGPRRRSYRDAEHGLYMPDGSDTPTTTGTVEESAEELDALMMYATVPEGRSPDISSCGSPEDEVQDNMYSLDSIDLDELVALVAEEAAEEARLRSSSPNPFEAGETEEEVGMIDAEDILSIVRSSSSEKTMTVPNTPSSMLDTAPVSLDASPRVAAPLQHQLPAQQMMPVKVGAQPVVLQNGARNALLRKEWTEEEDEFIKSAVAQGKGWRYIASRLPGRSDDAVRNRWKRLDPNANPHSPPQAEHIATPKASKPKGDRVTWSPAEDAVILRFVQEHGHQWKSIAQCLPGRTEHAIRNRYQRLLTITGVTVKSP